jgi:acyl-CoA synthetase (AMP-forming)/AMP-acid ligase II
MAQLSGIGPSDWVTIDARRNPDSQCFARANGERLTFAQVSSNVSRLAQALHDQGLRKGDRLAVMAIDSVEYLELFLASMRIGTVIIPLNFRLTVDEVANLLGVTEPSAFFASSRYSEAMARAKEGLGSMLRFVGGVESGVDGAEASVQEMIASVSGEGILEGCTEDEDILVLPLTSGTTGTPKGVMQSQRMIKAGTNQGVVELGLKPDDFAYSGAPMFHISGMGHIFYLLARGASSLILPQFEVNSVLSWMQEGGLTRCMLIPSMVISLLEHPDVRKSSYDSIRSIMYGGAPIAPSVIREMIDVFQCDLFNGFGAGTEAGGQTMFTPDDHRRALAGEEHLLGSIGKAIYGVDVKLCDVEGNEVPRGEVGEINSRSDSVMSGYLDQPALTARSFHGAWFHAGDLAYIDEWGYMHLAGRANDMIIRGGENVYPVEIEDTLSDHPAVLEVVVVGLPDDYWGEVVAAVVVLRPGATLDLETMRAHCEGRIASYKIPTQLEILESLPKNPTGKILKHQVRSALILSTSAK